MIYESKEGCAISLPRINVDGFVKTIAVRLFVSAAR